MHPALETPRLILIPRTAEDNPALLPLFNNWDVVQFLSDAVPWPYPETGMDDYWREDLSHKMANGTEWCWTLRLKTNPDVPMGQINLRIWDEQEHRGFWLGKPYWGKGYMTEAADAVTRFWFMELNQPVLKISARVDNDASNRIKVSQGFKLVGGKDKSYAGGYSYKSLQWELTREEYIARRQNLAPQ